MAADATLQTNIDTNTTAIGANAMAIASNDTDIAANLAAIQANDADIATNAAGIVTNVTNIGANAMAITALDGRVTTNEGNIATNTTSIATNTAGIATNVTNIAANTTAIGVNTGNIATNAAGIQTNAAGIATNATNILNNTASIVNLASQGAAQQTQINALFGETSRNRDDINRANEGVAMALAMESPALQPGTNFALSGGVGYFQDRGAGSMAVTARISENAAFSAGLGVGLASAPVQAQSVQPGATLQRPSVPPPPSLRPTPSQLELSRMIWSTVAAVDHANRSGNYSVLRDISAQAFQINYNPAKLTEIFAGLRNSNIDLSTALLVPPTYTEAPQMVREDLFRVKGLFQLRPISITFDMFFQWEQGRWKLAGIDIQPAEMVAAQPSPSRRNR